MKKIACLLLLVIFSSGVAGAWEQVEVLAVEGSAQYCLDGHWQELLCGTKISQGAQIRTFEDTLVLLAIPGGHEVLLGSNVELALSSIAPTDVRLHLSLGKVWSRVRKKIEGFFKFEIETPSAVAGVRGTQFSVEVSFAGFTRVSVREGRVWVGNKLQEQDLHAGQSITADALRGLARPQPMDMQEQREWEQLFDNIFPGQGPKKIPPGLEKKREKWKQWWEELPLGRPWREGVPFGLEKEGKGNNPKEKSPFEDHPLYDHPNWIKKKEEFLANFPPKKKDSE